MSLAESYARRNLGSGTDWPQNLASVVEGLILFVNSG